MNGLTKALAAEFTGTFALIFLGAGAATARTIGPAVATGVHDGIAIYLVAQFVGRHDSGLLCVLGDASRFRTA
jgi:glycerol uptake facilitator-like aquaporin